MNRMGTLLGAVVMAALAMGAPESVQAAGETGDSIPGLPGVGVVAAPIPVRSSTDLTEVTTRAAGRERTYFYHLPPQARGGRRLPLVLAFHGGGGRAPEFAARVGLIEMADKYGYILVLPQGTSRNSRKGGSWNADSTAPVGYAEKADVDDVGFVARILDEMKSRAPYDVSRVYATGMSAGGMMAYHVACELPPGTIQAVAPVAATLSSQTCSNQGRGISLLHIQGTNDQNVPMQGGRGSLSSKRADWPPARRGVELFSSANACSPGRDIRMAQDTICRRRSCAGGDVVELCTVENGGHAWPGAEPANWQRRRGVYVSPYFDASDYIGRFFARH